MISLLLEFLLNLWAAVWAADERVNGPSRRRWPVMMDLVGGVALFIVWVLELARVL